MEHICTKCNERLTKCILYNGYDFKAVKANMRSFAENSSSMTPYVCPACGHVDWFVEQPENFK